MKKEKKIKKRENIRSGLIITFCILLGAATVLFGFNFDDYSVKEYFVNLATSSYMTYKATSFENENFVNNVSNFCHVFEDKDFVKCVVKNVGENYIYNSSHNERKLIKRPEEFIESGGVCRDVAVIYDSIFKKKGWVNEYRFDKPNHVFNVVSNKNLICFIDGDKYECI